MVDTPPLRFILQAIDPDRGNPAFEAMFVVERPEELRALLGEGAANDPELDLFYTLEPEELIAISRAFDVPFDPQGYETCLYRWTYRREAPYLIHTGYELALMLEGRKPFARMGGDFYPPEQHYGEELFDRYVAQDVLHREIDLEKFEKPRRWKDGRVLEGFRTVYYTLKGQEWRIPAWKLVSKGSGGEGWNDTLERLEGMLLGYEDWQNAWHIEGIRKRKVRFGTVLVYLAVYASELCDIDESGCRALPRTDRMLHLVSSLDEQADDSEPGRLMETAGMAALVRFRVKTIAFFNLVDERLARHHHLPPERIKDLNRMLVENIEIVLRRTTET